MARPGHLYVMDAGNGLVKVGFARRPERRSKEFRGASVLYRSPWHDNAERVERATHRLLKDSNRHVRGEIFSATVAECVHAIEAAFGMFARGEIEDVKPRPKRNRPVISFALDKSVLADLDQWIAAQEMKVTKSSVVERAIKEFLDKLDDKRP